MEKAGSALKAEPGVSEEGMNYAVAHFFPSAKAGNNRADRAG
jgi:hypothetical protein